MAAIAFYLGVASLTAGTMLAARHAIERRSGLDRRAVRLIVAGIVAITISVAVFAAGPRGMLPF